MYEAREGEPEIRAKYVYNNKRISKLGFEFIKFRKVSVNHRRPFECVADFMCSDPLPCEICHCLLYTLSTRVLRSFTLFVDLRLRSLFGMIASACLRTMEVIKSRPKVIFFGFGWFESYAVYAKGVEENIVFLY